jgi:hypothetical protein
MKQREKCSGRGCESPQVHHKENDGISLILRDELCSEIIVVETFLIEILMFCSTLIRVMIVGFST